MSNGATRKKGTAPGAESGTGALSYGGSEKHQKPWQRGRKGSMCSKETIEVAQALLDASVDSGGERFATDGERAFKGRTDGLGAWHGWPVGWKDVPDGLRRGWIAEGRVRKRSIGKFWDDHVGAD